MAKNTVGKNTVGEKCWNVLWNFLIFTRRKVFSDKISPNKVCQNCPNDKILWITCRKLKDYELFSLKEEKGKYQGDRFSFHYKETLTVTKNESREN